MAVNKVIFGDETIIDLTLDTVTAESLLAGKTAHTKTGDIVIGTLFDGFPEYERFLDNLLDSNGGSITDSQSNVVQSQLVYHRL